MKSLLKTQTTFLPQFTTERYQYFVAAESGGDIVYGAASRYYNIEYILGENTVCSKIIRLSNPPINSQCPAVNIRVLLEDSERNFWTFSFSSPGGMNFHLHPGFRSLFNSPIQFCTEIRTFYNKAESIRTVTYILTYGFYFKKELQ